MCPAQRKGEKYMARSDQNGMTNNAGIAYGDLIRRQRKAKKMNQEELGALVKVGKNAVGAWEAGRSRPDVGSVPVICDALDLSLEEFFGYPDRSGEFGADLTGILPEEPGLYSHLLLPALYRPPLPDTLAYAILYA